MVQDTGADEAGPSEAPPPLPEGWTAQWEGKTRKYYYVQISTGVSQWEVPTEPAPTVPTPGGTPQQTTDPFQKPSDPLQSAPEAEAGTARGFEGGSEPYGQDRGLVSDLATNMIFGKQNKQSHSGLGGLASSFLGGHGSQGSSQQQSSHSGGGLVGQIAGSLLGGHKPHGQQQQQQQQQQTASSTGHSQSNLMGIAGSILGGHTPQHQNQQSGYGYSSGGHSTSGGSAYTGQAPPAQYQPSGQHSTGTTPSHFGSSGTSQQHHGVQQYGTTSQHGYDGGSQYGQPSSGPYNPQQEHQGGFGGHHGQTSSQYGQHGGYGSPALGGGHNQPYGHQQSQHQYPPAPGTEPSYGHNQAYSQQASYDYPPPPPLSSHPQHQGGMPGQYPPGHGGYSELSGNQPGHGGSGYGQGGGYGNYGGPPAPEWR
ncbi:hypothetical protein L228DRAFT_262528 [Xylona heveae TC161]|uniref:WW domain-containing protein n=1 Tax=Xylona heveae (strain CBS 132557 / TC161) TaxID=1328760 RepID=A0A165AJS7_XYLHT|nr:hypothetical protein L228DRAFT_262528 [Xylona heveae TC161]KZF20595.1 hypothetical protein L228DRAFT_262528 [Xylona heveae TC161]